MVPFCGAKIGALPFNGYFNELAAGGVDTGVVVLCVKTVGVGMVSPVGVLDAERSVCVVFVYPVGVGMECVVDGVDTVVAGDTGVCAIGWYGCGECRGCVCFDWMP